MKIIIIFNNATSALVNVYASMSQIPHFDKKEEY